MLKDYFEVQGPNGSHSCLAYELMGPSLSHVLQWSGATGTNNYLTISCARSIVYQTLLGLDCLHGIGVVHGDIYDANVLFNVKDLSQEPMDTISQPYDLVTVDVRRRSGPKQPGDPQHLTLNRPLIQWLCNDGHVKLSDLGNGKFHPQRQPICSLLIARSSISGK